jgi:5-hydroxyisourate hydrolase-like protein (transthyretin family)
VVHANAAAERNDNYDIPEEVMEMEQENKSLRMELRRKEEALSLLIGAVRTNGNGKLEKYRMQAERILHGQESMRLKEEEREEERGSMLPKIHMKHQSIMHDYLLAAARRGKKTHF